MLQHQLHLQRRPATDRTERSESMPARALARHLDIPLLHFYWLKHLNLLPLPIRGAGGLKWAMPVLASPDFLSAMSRQRRSGMRFDESDVELRLVDGWSDGARVLVWCGHRWCAHGVKEPFPMRFPPCHDECTKGAFAGGPDWRMYCYIIDVHVDHNAYRRVDKLSDKQGEHNWEKLLWRKAQQNVVNELLGLGTEDIHTHNKPRRSTYPWDVWCNGEQHVATAGVDFDCSVESMRVQLYNRAKKMGLGVETSRTASSLYFCFNPKKIPAHTEPPPSAASHPWDTWCNGKQHFIISGVDFDCPVETMRIQLHNKAKKMGLKVRTSRQMNALYFTFEGREAPDGFGDKT